MSYTCNLYSNIGIPRLIYILSLILFSRARELDEKTATEIKDSLSSGVLKNSRNDAFTRLSQTVACKNSAKRKHEAVQEHDENLSEIQQEINELTCMQKESKE